MAAVSSGVKPQGDDGKGLKKGALNIGDVVIMALASSGPTQSIAVGIVGLMVAVMYHTFLPILICFIPMIGIGIAWGSILAMPYAMLANSIPPRKMGVYMGLFNMSITIPQIVSGIVSGLILKYFFADNPILCIVMAGVSMFLGALSALFIKEKM